MSNLVNRKLKTFSDILNSSEFINYLSNFSVSAYMDDWWALSKTAVLLDSVNEYFAGYGLYISPEKNKSVSLVRRRAYNVIDLTSQEPVGYFFASKIACGDISCFGSDLNFKRVSGFFDIGSNSKQLLHSAVPQIDWSKYSFYDAPGAAPKRTLDSMVTEAISSKNEISQAGQSKPFSEMER